MAFRACQKAHLIHDLHKFDSENSDYKFWAAAQGDDLFPDKYYSKKYKLKACIWNKKFIEMHF